MAAGGTDFLEGFGKGVGAVVNPLNIMTSTIDKVVSELVIFLYNVVSKESLLYDTIFS